MLFCPSSNVTGCPLITTFSSLLLIGSVPFVSVIVIGNALFISTLPAEISSIVIAVGIFTTWYVSYPEFPRITAGSPAYLANTVYGVSLNLRYCSYSSTVSVNSNSPVLFVLTVLIMLSSIDSTTSASANFLSVSYNNVPFILTVSLASILSLSTSNNTVELNRLIGSLYVYDSVSPWYTSSSSNVAIISIGLLFLGTYANVIWPSSSVTLPVKSIGSPFTVTVSGLPLIGLVLFVPFCNVIVTRDSSPIFTLPVSNGDMSMLVGILVIS